ncbi:MAG: hypothetical protein HOA38_00220 [Candidatus Marinimicrobia bacterium]|jgi:hypothetical protein|nr:hypothetical protein [Candidatus Neomarinimicrobiota bacterium]
MTINQHLTDKLDTLTNEIRSLKTQFRHIEIDDLDLIGAVVELNTELNKIDDKVFGLIKT